MSNETPAYYAVVPANIRYDKSLTPFARLMYGEITALSNKKGYCWATNKYFADLYEVTEDTVTRWIKQLESKHYITVEHVFRYNTKDKHPIKRRIIKIPHEDSVENNDECIDYKNAQCIDYKVDTNNITSNTNTDVFVSDFTNVKSNTHTSTALPAGDALLVNQRGLFNEEVSIQKKEKPNRLTQKEKEALDIIKEFFVEDDELHFNHRLPTKENNYKKTVLIKKVMRYLDYIQQGTFLEKVVLTGEQKKLNLYLLEKPRFLEDVKDICAMAVEYWKLHLTAGYKPDNKDFLIAMPLDQWFYNERTQFSWFVECLASKPRFSMAVDTDKVRDAIDPDFLKHFDKLYQHLWHDWEKEEWYQYYLGVQSIYGKYKQIFDWYDGVITKSGWVHYLSSPNMFAYSFYMFLRDYPHYDNLKILNTRGQLWRDWRRHAKEMWKIDVNPSQQFIDKCLDEDRIHEIEKRRWEQQEEIKRRKKEEEMLEELL